VSPVCRESFSEHPEGKRRIRAAPVARKKRIRRIPKP